ncbi:MAG TPA: MMPL family transporter [Trebonia sp.]|jgi:RND superfamily putative drug exporter|nr:MMPL family transporter [Trebonia sp.]
MRLSFESLGRATYRRRRLVLALAIVFVIFAGAWGTGVFSKLISGNTFAAPDSQSQRESDRAAAAFGRSDSDVVVLYRSADQTVADPAYRRAVTSTVAALPAADVARATTFWSSGNPGLVSPDKHATYAVLQLRGATDQDREDAYQAVKGLLGQAPAGFSAQVGGEVPTEVVINAQASANVARAESISLPVLLVLLAIIFGSAVAALLPVAIGGMAILGSLTVLRLLTLGTPVSVYSINVTTVLGLGLGIDYGLLIVTRFREELRRQPSVEQAIARTVATAGRTVLVSGVTVAVALCSLMLFPEVFLRSMGYGGVATVLVDMIAALTVLPALLAVLGHRVNALRLRRGVGRAPRAQGGWYRLARGVMRRPAAITAVIVIALLALGAPFLKISWGGTDARVLPASATVRQVQEKLDSQFAANSAAPVEALVTGAASPAAVASYIGRIEAIHGVAGATVTGSRGAGAGAATRIDIGYVPWSQSPAARQVVSEVRALAPPPGTTVAVGGTTATLVDELSSLGATLPWMALLTGLATFTLLFLAFGSVILPVKAVVMNFLSLSATFGVIVWIFQWGHLSGLLRFTPTGTIDPTMPILLLALVFGLSMDYEVFLLSRIREIYDETGDNNAAIAGGLQRTGGVITSLALLLIVVIGLFSASGIVFLKLLGVGMVVALVLDAAVVRTLLVPATMRLLGRANWWAPGPLGRLYARHGIREEESPEPVYSSRAVVGLTARENGPGEP